ncbi:zinc finger protein CONSTANS-LIKE 4-like [Aristolochia californica]|uniref:zinc finger protein CONSTANS-LIKE 4-like n=1 Tax=Aristolochia californica TaxID=171875 RepID=UPI0035DB1046
MKECELCHHPARMYCESDQASLCWDCDAKVHGANFLVARHSRSLLCQNCQSPTPWSASGAKLGPTVSVCEGCLAGCNREGQVQVRDENEVDEDGEEEGDEDDDDYGNEEENEEGGGGDNQVVPWSSSTPPPAATSSSSEGSPVRIASAYKRMRENIDLISQDDVNCSAAMRVGSDDEATVFISPRRKKAIKLRPSITESVPGQSRTGLSPISSIGRFQLGDENESPATAILDIRKLGRPARTVDLISGSSLERPI